MDVHGHKITTALAKQVETTWQGKTQVLDMIAVVTRAFGIKLETAERIRVQLHNMRPPVVPIVKWTLGWQT
jgi:hypothetical protein